MSLTLDHSQSTVRSWRDGFGFTGTLALRAFKGIGAIIAAEIDRRQTLGLMALDARELSDMGISRSDVAGALLTEIGTKPSYVLAQRREEARAAREAQILEVRTANN
ncbi:DUF1127 domain-containing protein [Oryzibacter oryziterrae]|uniref:DUF1127 domain-containing protein n=1 Tax=Oryzibacter oryziterrae TaxID=2766474 RepID=UPI001F1FB9DF|nr:DUF1127 domain-containing protein [Oryzibacter oryziterrae]